MAESTSKIKDLKESGIVMLSGHVKDESIRTVSESILQINQIENPDFKSIQLILNSPGGNAHSGFMLIDLIEYSKMPVYITGLGVCASMGILLLCCGAKGHRVITKNTTLLSHQYSWSADGKYHELVAARKGQDDLHKRLMDHYLRHTDLSDSDIKKFLMPESDVWLTPKQAKRYGIVDKIID